MASFNLTVEDSSPLISYAPAGSWTDTPSNDASSYSGGSYHTTSTRGATATINFKGTGLSIFGGHRPNYGTYSLSVDGRAVSTGSSESSSTLARQMLGTVAGLPYDSHTAVLTNTGGEPIDIDWVDFVGRVGVPGSSNVQINKIDDNDPAIGYAPADGWKTNSGSSFESGTLHFSQATGASATVKFSGEAVAVYGTMSPDHANIRVTVDGKSQVYPGGASGRVSALHAPVLLYYGSDFGPGQHTLVLAADGQQTADPFIDMDSVAIFTAADPVGGSASPTTGSGSASNTAASAATTLSTRKMPTGAVVGAALGGIIAFISILALAAFLFLRNRRNRSTRGIGNSMISMTPSPVLPMQQRSVEEVEAGITEKPAFLFPPPKATYISNSSSLRHSIAPSYYVTDSTSPSRDGNIMSGRSSRALISVPKLDLPRPQGPRQSNPRKTSSRSASMDTDISGSPARPKRPPTMDLGL